MQRTYSYEVVALDRPSIAGDSLFTVVETVDGVCRGGDHHWVRERYALRAADLYRTLAEAGADLPRGILVCHHGAPSDVCAAAYRAITGTPMFDADPLVATNEPSLFAAYAAMRQLPEALPEAFDGGAS